MIVSDGKTCLSQWTGSKQCMCMHVFKCITLAVMSLLLGLPPPDSIHTHKHTLTLLSPWQHRPAVSPAGLSWRSTGGPGSYEGRRVGLGGSTAEQMQKPLLGSPGTGSFPATPQPCSCPRTSCPDDRTKQTRDFLSVVVGWGRSGGGAVVIALYGPADTLNNPNPQSPLLQTKTIPDKTCLEMHCFPFDLWLTCNNRHQG